MCNAFYEVANLAADFENAYKNVMTQICEMKGELKEGGNACGSNKPISIDIQNDSTSCGNDLVISKEARKILDLMVVCQKGQPSFKRKMSKVEQAVKKKKEKEKKMKMKTIINEGNAVNQVETSILEEICEKDYAKVGNVHSTNSTMGFGMLEMHESFNFNDFEMQQSQSQHIGDKSCQFFPNHLYGQT